MYRIYDFHSPLAPPLQKYQSNPFSFNDESDEDENSKISPPDPSKYEHFFNVTIGEDTIYIEDVSESNEAGWTPLHACCMSFITVPAGEKIIDELIKIGANLDTKTIQGPGSFNKGWTPLHMACAYGVEPLVERLVKEGADVNTTNAFGYTPMLEACHRGFINIVQFLLKGRVNLSYIPHEEVYNSSPFINAPPQSPLGEACHCGFPRIAQLLLDAGSNKDQSNRIGWVPLHEACFYNRAEVTKTLLLNGANAAVRNDIGALPYHLAGLKSIKAMLQEMGGPDAVPDPSDAVDMSQVLEQLTKAMSHSETVRNSRTAQSSPPTSPPTSSKGPVLRSANFDSPNAAVSSSSTSATASSSERLQLSRRTDRDEQASPSLADHKAGSGLLHSGRVLGDLPALSPVREGASGSPSHSHTAASAHMSFNLGPNHNNSGSKKEKKKKSRQRAEDCPTDAPQAFMCQLSLRLMADPVKSLYGNFFDRTAICNWFTSQGKICPLTGMPLSELDLEPAAQVAADIREWQLQRAGGTSPKPQQQLSAKQSAPAEEDIYDF